MTEVPGEELSLRDIVDTLKRQRVWVVSLPLVFGALALIYGFFIAESRYASTATVNVAPVQVQAQLEQRIQVQGQSLLSFQALRAIAYSEEVTREVWETLRREGKLPTAWQDQGGRPGLERMVKDFRIKNETPRQQVVPPVVASLTVEAPSPEVAAKAANLWAEGVVKRFSRIPYLSLEVSLQALEEEVAKAERTYREALANFEAFRRATTLGQDQAELEALTGERLQNERLQNVMAQVVIEPRPGERIILAQELSRVKQDLAAVQAKIRFLEREIERPTVVLPDQPSSPAREGIQNTLLDAKVHEAELLARKAALEARISQVEARINLLKEWVARAQVEEEGVRQALELARNAYVALAQKRTDLQIELASSQNSLAQLIAPAYPIYEKVAPKRGLILALAFSLGLGLGVMAAFVAEALRPPRPEVAAG